MVNPIWQLENSKWRIENGKQVYRLENGYLTFFSIAGYKSEVEIQKFKMADPTWWIENTENRPECENVHLGIFLYFCLRI